MYVLIPIVRLHFCKMTCMSQFVAGGGIDIPIIIGILHSDGEIRKKYLDQCRILPKKRPDKSLVQARVMMHHYCTAYIQIMKEPQAKLGRRRSDVKIRCRTTLQIIISRIVCRTSLEKLVFRILGHCHIDAGCRSLSQSRDRSRYQNQIEADGKAFPILEDEPVTDV